MVATALYAALNELSETDLPQQWLQRPKSSMPRQVARSVEIARKDLHFRKSQERHMVATALYAALNGLSETDLPQQWLQRPKSSMPRQVARSGQILNDKAASCIISKLTLLESPTLTFYQANADSHIEAQSSVASRLLRRCSD
ncbi:hypothetical protein HPB47_004248 [Ixodes persulcatus]|uniref:Uncharacterized protein n=1 Tax=Ixodes persulcatus TaxID=34615 RepID=A0AC60PHE8_IXOPE|nr:hypothetical protein HPB47_004248 [Ixodes persulcatus]